MTLASLGNKLSQFQASELCRWKTSDSASHTFRSGKNEIMGILVHGEVRAPLALAFDQRAGDVSAFLALAVALVLPIDLLERADDQGAHRGAGPSGCPAQLAVQ